MSSFWVDEVANWMRLGGRVVGDSAQALVELTDRALQPWDELLDAAAHRLAGREVEYVAGGVTERGTIESFRVTRAGRTLSADIEAVITEPTWGDHTASDLRVRAEGVQLLPGPLPEVRAERIELTATFAVATVRRWFDESSVTLERLGPDDAAARWRWRRLNVSLVGSPMASGTRVHFVLARLVVFGRMLGLPRRPEFTLSLPIDVPAGLTLTEAMVDRDTLVVTAVAHNVSEPIRPDQVLAAVDGGGPVRLERPS